MRILITGASGSMGHYLAKHIQSLNEGHVVWGLGRRPIDQVRLTGLDRYINCDLIKGGEVYSLFTVREFDVVFHLAGVANVRQSFYDQAIFLNNVHGALRLFDAIRNGKCPLPKVVLCSTSEVYGNAESPINEQAPYAPINPYAASKVTQEIIAETYQRIYGFPLVITRAFGYINPLREDLVATRFARQFIAVERRQGVGIEHGDLTPVRSFADARDIAEAYWLAATRCEPGAYNIGAERACSIGGLLSIIEDQFTFKPARWQVDALARPTDIFECYPDAAKFRAATDWRPKISLEESVIWLIGELRANGE